MVDVFPAAQRPGRKILTANATYYVRTDGSDSNNGLANTSGGAFLTIQKAIDTAAGLDSSIYNVTIQIADGTYTGSITLKNMVGAGSITIQGNSSTPANVLISTSGSCFSGTGLITAYTIKDLKVTSSASTAIVITGGSAIVSVGNIDFGSVTYAHMKAVQGGRINVTSNYAITAGGTWHMLCDQGGWITANTKTVTLTGTPAFSVAFAQASSLSELYIIAITYSGSATGKRYDGSANSVIHTNGGGASYFPGNSAGSTATGAQYI